MKYTVVESKDSNSLIKKVNELLAKGWEPAPGLAVDYTGGKYFQALIHKEKDQEDT